jgi:transposase
MQSKIKPMKKFARSMQRHKPLILNYLKARGELSSGTVEGMYSLAKLAIRKSSGFKTEHALKVTLFHQLGKLQEPELTHRLW